MRLNSVSFISALLFPKIYNVPQPSGKRAAPLEGRVSTHTPNGTLRAVLKIFKQWLAMVERQSGHKLKFFHTDGGKEYTGKTAKNTFTTFL
jgi:hypothetical protein